MSSGLTKAISMCRTRAEVQQVNKNCAAVHWQRADYIMTYSAQPHLRTVLFLSYPHGPAAHCRIEAAHDRKGLHVKSKNSSRDLLLRPLSESVQSSEECCGCTVTREPFSKDTSSAELMWNSSRARWHLCRRHTAGACGLETPRPLVRHQLRYCKSPCMISMPRTKASKDTRGCTARHCPSGGAPLDMLCRPGKFASCHIHVEVSGAQFVSPNPKA